MPASSWPVGSAWPNGISWPESAVWPASAFPASVVPTVWFDGNQQAYSDLAGTVPVSSGLIRRVNEPSAQGGAWTTPTDADRPLRDSNSIRFYLNTSSGGNQMTRPDPGGVFRDACTIVVAYMARDNSFAGPTMGLIEDSTQQAGIRISSNTIWGMTTAGNFFTSLTVAPGKLNVIAMTLSASGTEIKLDADGVVSTQSTGAALSHTAAGSWILGRDGSSYLYGSISQALVVPRALSSAERDSVMAWAKSQAMATAYPDDRALVAYVGDSITRSTGATYGNSYPFRTLESIRTTKPLTENCDTAIGGIGVTNILRAGSPYTRSAAFYSASRIKNVMVWLLGTNDLANGNSVAYTLYGTGAPDGAGLYAGMAAAKAMGWKNVVLTIGPRSDAMGVSQAVFDANRAAANNDIAANWALYADRFVDTRIITNFGADGDSNNATYYSADKVHPIDAGHALLYPSVASAVLSLL